jgi:glycosyltransferase involved in cell wall biosynthesis
MIHLSIIVPAYNVEKYIEDCISSIPYSEKFNIEVLVIDDGSSDLTAKIVSDIMSVDSRVVLFSFKNGGLSVARNRGIERAKGKYIMFLDSDDSLDGAELLICLDEVFKYEVDCYFISGKNYYDKDFEGNKEDKLDARYIRESSQLFDVVKSRDAFNDYVNKRKYIVSACMFIVKSNFINNLRFVEGIYYEDNIFTTKLMLQDNGSVITTNKPIYLRRVRNDSITTGLIGKKNINDLLFCYDDLTNYRKSFCPLNCNKSLDVFLLSLIKNIGKMLNSNNDLSFITKNQYRYNILRTIFKRPFVGGGLKFSYVVAILLGAKI